MTMITLGNLPTFNFMVTDTQKCDMGLFNKLQFESDQNKIFYSQDENCTTAFTGAVQIYLHICNTLNVNLLDIISKRQIREDIITDINTNLKALGFVEPQNCILCIMNRNEIVRWEIAYNDISNTYQISSRDVIPIPAGSIYMLCFGTPINNHDIIANDLTPDNYITEVFNKMIVVNKQWKTDNKQTQLRDIQYHSSAHILKDIPTNPYTIIKYFNDK